MGWEIGAARIGTGEELEYLKDDWEPFAVEQGTMWFRRQQYPPGQPITETVDVHGVRRYWDKDGNVCGIGFSPEAVDATR